MKSLWNEAQARGAVEQYGARGVGEDLALRTYSARLLGAERTLVLHGGGNTSVKTRAADLFGEEIEVLCVKGSGWDLATIEPAGHPAVRLAPLLRLRSLDGLADEAMVNFQRLNLLDAAAPNPSVETLLHAFIGAKFIDHAHAEAILALANQADAPALIGEALGNGVAVVPYVMPGFALAKAAAEIWDADPTVPGMVLLNHGLFTFGDTARQSYERMIALVSAAEDFIEARRPPTWAPSAGRFTPRAGAVLPVMRGLIAAAAAGAASPRRVFDLRAHGAAGALAHHPALEALAARGVATPDHVIRTKRLPLVLARPEDDLAPWRAGAQAALERFGADYRSYFTRHAPAAGRALIALDSLPRVAAIPGLGLVGIGATSGEAGIAADIASSWAATVLAAEAVGRFAPLSEADTFAMEYWSLEQAKLGKAKASPLRGRIVVVTGGAGAIGAAAGAAFAAEGAEVALLDVNGEGAERAAAAIGPRVLGLACDVTDPAAVEAAFEAVAVRFGGLDILVSNAGAAVTGAMASLQEADLRRSFEINFFGHQNVARAAVAVMRAQAMGGVLLFNVSKQAVAPGPDFGAYGTAKAALLALMRQYALEHGGESIRANAINADRIRSGLLTPTMIAARAASRRVSEADYMGGNLLHREVTAADVAAAFVFAARMEATTGAVITVDGGNVGAMMR